ncbi:nuclear protein localization protein 4 homolog [Saccoglossus kowalevskii]|uniref:Nuclear protein localization protein 4 homolog n=1 Tax=Saccoglossus kowalevskii TaxID=10224 RepID=A0ABM0GMP1_SACKO|nr:PREDICTED: nuclear protein localization protein 4 homolog [Saccoglossus kowalevskii]
MSKSIIIRIQCPDGQKRINLLSNDTATELLKKVSKVISLSTSDYSLYRTRDKTGEINSSRKSLSALKIHHGDMLFAFPHAGMTASNDSDAMDTSDQSAAQITIPSASSGPSTSSAAFASDEVVEDEVDQYISTLDGKIQRDRDEQLCRHGPRGKCVHCAALEPFDEEYLKKLDPPIKHMSFHAYIRKLTSGVDRGKFAMLENISCKIKSGCSGHLPWPEGICTKCQPSAVTLNRQHYRHVDNVLFENPRLFDRFIDYWRKSGNQRAGLLYGRYEYHESVPLGIKASVSAIYEPPQDCTPNSIEFLDDPHGSVVDEIAGKLGLRKVGWIFTDLVAEDLRKGTVKHVRNMDAHFLSAEECIMAGEFQNQNPNKCKLATDGNFGSKFVTVIVTGDSTNQIHTEAYQVSNQCMALVNDDCLIPTKDAPELGYIKESSNEQYVPDVFYKMKDSYNNEVALLARPLPVEYLIIDVPAGFPLEPKYTFLDENERKFPIENRSAIAEIQNFETLSQYLQYYPAAKLLDAMCDLHVLLYLATMDIVPLKNHMDGLLLAVKDRDVGLMRDWTKGEHWATIEQLIQAHSGSSPSSAEGAFLEPSDIASGGPPASIGGGSVAALWTCKHCTFINQPPRRECEICGLPHH